MFLFLSALLVFIERGVADVFDSDNKASFLSSFCFVLKKFVLSVVGINLFSSSCCNCCCGGGGGCFLGCVFLLSCAHNASISTEVVFSSMFLLSMA